MQVTFRMRTAIVVAIASLTAVCAPADDWPQFRGPNADGMSVETGINLDWAKKAPATLWTATLHDQGYSGPAVANGKVFIVDHQEGKDAVLAFDLESGDEGWRFTYEAPGDENFGFARSTPCVDGKYVYTMSRDGVVHCLDIKSGKKVWRQEALASVNGKAPKWGVSNSPIIDGPRLIVAGGGKGAHLLALNKKNGKILWKGGKSAPLGYATPVVTTIDGKSQYLNFSGKGLSGIQATNGDLLWSHPWPTKYDINAATPIHVGGSLIFISSGYKTGCSSVQIKGGNAREVWRSKDMNAHFSTPILVDGLIYGTGDPGFLICLDPKTGDVKWKEPGFEKGGVIGIDGHIIAVSGNTGDVVLVEITPDAYREKGRIKPLGGQSWTAPVVSNKRLIIRNKGKLIVLDLS
jgi:outer membrane protein assembly factor BamB